MTTNDEYLTRLKATMEDLNDSVATFKGMIYGVSGVGKTVLAMQIAQAITPSTKKILFVDTAEGWVSFKNHPELKARSQRMSYRNLDQMVALCLAIKSDEELFNQFGSIILDEATSAADGALDQALKDRASSKRGEDPDTPTQPDFNLTTNRVRRAYNELLTLPGVHVILVGHARKDKDARNVEVTSASFLPKLGAKIKQPLHLIAHLSGNEFPPTEENPEGRYVRVMQVHPTRTIDAKSRIGGLKPQVEMYEFIPQLKKWLGGEVKSVDQVELVIDHDPEVVSVEGD